jgi:hypothetical protein
VKPIDEEDLILFFYGEHPTPAEIERALETDPELRRRLDELRRDLSQVDDPASEPGPGFEDRLWRRLAPRLERPTWRDRLFDFGRLGRLGRLGRPGNGGDAPAFGWRPALLAALLAGVALAGYWAGRRDAAPAPLVAEDPGPAVVPLVPKAAVGRERVLLASVGRHLESSSLLLTDLANAPASGELGDEAEWARALLASNRLYRQAAERAGQRRIVALLDELEPVLVELAHHPSSGGVVELQHRIDERDLLFKVRSVGGRLEQQGL